MNKRTETIFDQDSAIDILAIVKATREDPETHEDITLPTDQSDTDVQPHKSGWKKVGEVALVTVMAAGSVFGATKLLLYAADHWEQYVHEESNELYQRDQNTNNKLDLDSGIVTLPAPSQNRP